MTDDFEKAVEEIRNRKRKTERDRIYEMLGFAILVSGALLAFIAYFIAGSQNSGNSVLDNLEHNELIILSMAGISLAISGAAIFLRYSITRFLRFWLIRQIYENRQRLNVDGD